MNHFDEQNGPFCDVKWLILKIETKISEILSRYFVF